MRDEHGGVEGRVVEHHHRVKVQPRRAVLAQRRARAVPRHAALDGGALVRIELGQRPGPVLVSHRVVDHLTEGDRRCAWSSSGYQ
eukprot:scaffold70091_cov56-Phaeocystis_antarctica.AAC.2